MHQYGKVNPALWSQEFNVENVPLSDKLDTMVNMLNTEFTRVADKLAPLKEVKTSLRPKRPWYDADIKQHKRRVRKLEKSGLSIS